MAGSAHSSKLVSIDGSFGEGGGQILRTSLALSLVTGRPVAIEGIRAQREKPGLRPAHLTAVRAAAKVGQAEVSGDAIGSRRLVFRPRETLAGNYKFSIGTAGSTSLVFQTVLPALWRASGESTLVLEGGTHNMLAPPFEFLSRVFLPRIAQMGPSVEISLERPGFYPAGGGCLRASIRPVAALGRLELLERGALLERRVRILLARLPRHIAEREQSALALATGWPESCFEIDPCPTARGPGNAVLIELTYEQAVEVCTGFGRRGVPAEAVAHEALAAAQQFEAAGAPVGEHLADQLLLPLALGAHAGTGGGTFLTGPLSSHARTQIEVLKKFLPVQFETRETSAGGVLVSVSRGEP